jgi:predicted dehydrogenase
MIEFNGEYGCMGDLGMHLCHLPFRAGWQPKNVRAILSNIMTDRPDGHGKRVPCETWDNATLLCETVDPATQSLFPWTFKTFRIAPGERNTWYINIYGTKSSARFSLREPKRFELLEYQQGKDQVWGTHQTAYHTPFKTITGLNFEFGFPDAQLQMWAAFVYELTHGQPLSKFTGCATPEESALSHRLFTAALASQKQCNVQPV